jgi:hypothetical protein
MMDFDQARYHGWEERRLRSPWTACLAIVRVALVQVFRNKAYWVVLGLGTFRFLAFWSIIWAVTQLTLGPDMNQGILREFGFTADSDGDQNNGYIRFMEGQQIIVMILLAFSGSLLVGADFRLRTLPFYLSRRIDKRHYIVGKLLAVSSIISLLTVVPALLLFFEYGVFTASTQYWIDNWQIPLSVLMFGLVLCVVNSILLVTLSAYLQRIVPITITWATIFLLLGSLSGYLRRATENENWRLLDPWWNMRIVGRMCFGSFRTPEEAELAWKALALLVVVCSIAMVALVHRVRAVDVVE